MSSQTASETILKLQKQILSKLELNFEDSDKTPIQGFDMSKLEALKEKSNKNFFSDMDKIKTGKHTNDKKLLSTAHDNNDFLNLGVKNETLNNLSVKQNQELLNNDFINLDFDVKQQQPQKTNIKDDDILNLGVFTDDSKKDNPIKTQTPQIYNDFDLGLNFGSKQENNKNTALQDQKSYEFLSFDLNPKVNPMSLAKEDTNQFISLGNNTQESKKSGQVDPFNFIVF